MKITVSFDETDNFQEYMNGPKYREALQDIVKELENMADNGEDVLMVLSIIRDIIELNNVTVWD